MFKLKLLCSETSLFWNLSLFFNTYNELSQETMRSRLYRQPSLIIYLGPLAVNARYSLLYVCMYVWSSHIAEYGSTGQGCQSCSWSAEQGK